MLVDLTPGALSTTDLADGTVEQHESIGELLGYLLDQARALETGSVVHGDFLAGYRGEEQQGMGQAREPTAADRASARRVG